MVKNADFVDTVWVSQSYRTMNALYVKYQVFLGGYHICCILHLIYSCIRENAEHPYRKQSRQHKYLCYEKNQRYLMY